MPTRFWTEPKVQSVGGGFPFSRTNTSELSGGFASLKTEWSYIKKGAKSCKNKPDSMRSQPNPARSSGI